ncbi:VIT family-domain-containing protein [Sphaerosporella brunnea]|uniref:VIT family-domain-containing protein n=1 Tax=Sphaerosporella brunnea TaxID=1250544 RepID=A0A5J5EK40_9PEZI|nr:VIT family-domain-containing protein [Sphaerosporella brunnea]
MSIVALKNAILPSSSERSRGQEAAPLLPTTIYNACSPANQPWQDCPHPECPLKRRPSLSSQTSTTASSSSSPSNGGSSRKPWLDARTISDAIIGLSDGLTVPFALTAGLSAFNDTRVVIFGGCAELIAGSISMGLGGWLAGRGEAEFYEHTLTETEKLVASSPSEIPEIIHDVFRPYHLPHESIAPLVDSILKDPVATINFIMAFHHSLPPSESTKRTPLSSALTIAAGYFIGGAIPLLPYFFVARTQVMIGLLWSVGVMAACLFLFGVARVVAVGEGNKGWMGRVRGGIEMMVVGGVAAGASWGIVKALGDGS